MTCSKRVVIDGYPYLVLQNSNAAAKQPVIRIKMAEVVAHLTHRPECSKCKAERPVLCHYDVPMQQHHRLQWRVDLQPTSSSCPVALPIKDRCFSKMCCNPLCLVYNTQNYNAKTGSSRHQMQTRQARGGIAQPAAAAAAANTA